MLEDRDLQSIQDVRQKVEQAHEAAKKFRDFSQEQVDRIIDAVAAAARAASASLAKLAVEETGYGNVHDKIAKNLLNSDILHQAVRPLKTVGIVNRDDERGLIEIAEPVGVVAAILPTTNPTSTVFFKTLISLKGRNTIVISPHPRAVKCTCEAARICYEAALAAGAPEDVIQCITPATLQGTQELMKHKRTSVLLTTGGAGLVRAAYSSGKPAYGVGPGNVPVLLDTTANVEEAIASVVDGKSFDYGTVCSSEQTVVAEQKLRDQIFAALHGNQAYVCNDEETAALEKLLITPDFRINPDCVGQSPQKIAQMAGFSIPAEDRILVVELEGVGRQHPLSAEKLSPVLSVYFVPSFEAAVDACVGVLNFGGRGHTCCIYSQNENRVEYYGLRAPAFRVLVNTPSPQGSTGITTNVFPSMTLGCGAIAGNITSDNVGPMHLINIKRIAFKVRDVANAFTSAEGKAYLAGDLTVPGAATPLPSPSTTPSTPVATSNSDIAAAVDRYLAERGLASAPAADAPVASAHTGAKPSARQAAQQVVDSFLATRAPTATADNTKSRDAAAIKSDVVFTPPVDDDSATAPPAPVVRPVKFVCEADIRKARSDGSKIYVTRSTIVTPAARDLDTSGDILVLTE